MGNKYGIRKTVKVSFEEAVEKITAKLKEQGFGVLTEIDMQATLKKKIGADMRRYTILGACNPNLAHRAVQSETEIGLLLPCNVIVYENDDSEMVVSAADPLMMMEIADNPQLDPIAREARERLEAAVNGI